MTGKNTILSLAIIAFGLCISLKSFAQDKVYMNRGSIIEGTVTEVSPHQVKILMNVRPEGPVYIVNIIDIDSIAYANGTKDYFKGHSPMELMENIPELNTWTFDILGNVFLTMSQSYERRLKSGIVGFRVPLYIGYIGGGIAGEGIFTRATGVEYPNSTGRHSFSIATGLNPKFYLFRRRIVRVFVGPEVTLGFSEAPYGYEYNYYGSSYGGVNQNGTFAATCKVGLSLNPIDKFNITFDGGAGVGDLFGGLQPLGVVGLWHIGFAMGTNF